MKALIVCDSFKGSLTSEEVGKCVQAALRQKNIYSDYLPVSDGGEGYLDALRYCRPTLQRQTIVTCDSLFRTRENAFLVGEGTLYFSLGDTVGIGLLEDEEIDAYRNSTYGLGLLMREAIINHRPSSVVLAIGGSATDDLGLGILEGMGATFYAGKEKLDRITLKDFGKITDMDLSEVYHLTEGVRFTTLTDVRNPLLGSSGATFVYGMQKGLKKHELPAVDALMAATKDKLVAATENKKDPAENAGSGAAGGVGFMMQAVFGSEIKSGIDELLEIANFGERVKNYDVVITGEGCLDEQSLNGKVISGIMKYAVKKLVIISAIKKIDCENAYAIVPDITTVENSLLYPQKYLRELICRIF